MENILNITREEANDFLSLQEAGDSLALKYLRNILEINKSDNGAIRIVRAALELNAYIELMELNEIPFNLHIDTIYRDLMSELIKHAQNCTKNSKED